MVSVHIDGSGFHTLAADITAAAANMLPAAEAAVRKTALDIEREAKAFAPVDTGNLRSSIGRDVEVSGDAIEAEIGPTAHYGIYLEHGTSRMAPHAFLGPALDRATPPFLSAMEQVVTRSFR